MKAYTDKQINEVLDQKPNAIDTVTFDRTRFEAWYIELGKREEKRDLSIPYKTDNGSLVKFREDGSGFGLEYHERWNDNSSWVELSKRYTDGEYHWQPATVKEWEDMLIKQAEKREYKNGNYKCLFEPDNTAIIDENSFSIVEGDVWQNGNIQSNNIFDNESGKWAEIIEQPTVDLVSAVQMIADKLEMNINVK